MYERKASRICLTLVPLLVVCLLVVGGGTAGATMEAILVLDPDGLWKDEVEDYVDICSNWKFSTQAKWYHWEEVRDADTSTYISNPYSTTGAQDAYKAEITGDWESQQGESYTRQLTCVGKFPSAQGRGDVTVEVWRLDEPWSECDGTEDIISSIGTLIDTYEVSFQDNQSWVAQDDVLQGAGTDPTSGYGVVLRITGDIWQTGHVYVADFHILYQKRVP